MLSIINFFDLNGLSSAILYQTNTYTELQLSVIYCFVEWISINGSHPFLPTQTQHTLSSQRS